MENEWVLRRDSDKVEADLICVIPIQRFDFPSILPEIWVFEGV